MKGRYPDILSHPEKGTEATKLFNDAQAMLKRIVAEKWLTAHAVFGLYPANTVGDDDIEVYGDANRQEVIARFYNPRQQSMRKNGVPNLSLADFLAPKGHQDHLGAFAVTTGLGIEKWVKHFEESHDDYSAILLKSLADRLAEAFAEYLHEAVRKDYWGYASEEVFDTNELIKEKYAGIRPAPGYPANPDHTEKLALFKLLDVEKHTGISLTESLAMFPAASVSGLYFSHPESRYFGVGKIMKDQVTSLAERKGMDLEEMERWLSPILGY